MAKKDEEVTKELKPSSSPALAPKVIVPAAPQPHPLELENAALKARVAKLEAALRHAVHNGINYTLAHEALNS